MKLEMCVYVCACILKCLGKSKASVMETKASRSTQVLMWDSSNSLDSSVSFISTRSGYAYVWNPPPITWNVICITFVKSSSYSTLMIIETSNSPSKTFGGDS
jgi:hypothetical protein